MTTERHKISDKQNLVFAKKSHFKRNTSKLHNSHFLSKWKPSSDVGKKGHIMNQKICSNQISTAILSRKLLDFSFSEPESLIYCLVSIVYKI